MSQLKNHALSPPLHCPSEDSRSWRVYWKLLHQKWRSEPEIEDKRQAYLAGRRTIIPDVENGRYPFSNIRLNRADIEWLLATHGNGSGPINWGDSRQRRRGGLDLRGADLSQVNLRDLPLARMLGGLTLGEWSEEQLHRAVVHLERATLIGTHMESAFLRYAQLEGADLRRVYLEKAFLQRAHLEEANLHQAHLEGADLREVFMEGADLSEASLIEARLRSAHLEGANLSDAHLEGADLQGAHLEGANINSAHLEGANLSSAHLEGRVMLQEDMERIRQWNEAFPVTLPPADLRLAFLDAGTALEGTILGDEKYGSSSLADVRWNGANLAVVNWRLVKQLGDEREAYRHKTRDGEQKDKSLRFDEYQAAVRANRQLAIALQAQGLNEEAVRFAYRAQVLQRKVLWHRRKIGQFIFSSFLNMLAGYGYKPLRSLLCYMIVIAAFALCYYLLGGGMSHHLTYPEALVVSLTAFHGRGFFSDQFSPADPQTLIAAVEAVTGLMIEISFIATFSLRFLGK